MRPGLAVGLLVLPAVAGAGSLRGSIFFPPNRPAAEVRPLSCWRVENNLLPVAPAPTDSRADAIVVLEPETPREPLPGDVTLLARALRLEPRVIVAALGSTVRLKNVDRVPRVLYLKDAENVLPREKSAPGVERTVKLSLPGEYQFLDDEYPHAGATVVVVRSSWFVHADEKGSFRIEAPDGKYTLRVYFRGQWSASQPVEVGRGGEVMVRLELPTNERK